MDQQQLAIEWVGIDQLFGNPANPRHNDQAVEAVAASLRRFGWQQPIVAKPSGEVIAGNTRLKAALQLGTERVPVVRFEGTDLDATAFAIADNRTGEIAEWDEDALRELLAVLQAEDALEGVGYSDEEIAALLAGCEEPEFDLDDPGPEPPPENPTSRLGDLWLLGDHRLLCGDSTKPDDLARLMAGEQAVLLAADPPYLVDYDGTNHPAEHHKKAGRKPGPGKEVGNKHWDAYKDPASSVTFFASFLRHALAHCVERVPIYQWHATRRQGLVEAAWEQNELLVHQTIIWAKPRGVLTRSHYLWAHEPCFYGWRKGMQPEKDRRLAPSERTVWEIEQAGEPDVLHPTKKPLEVFERPIRSHTRVGEVVLEPFSGSGTQIIAAERTQRRCRAMELSPPFVDVAVRRWERATGREAVLEGAKLTFAQVAAERGTEALEEATGSS